MSQFMLPQEPTVSREALREQIRRTVTEVQKAAQEGAKSGTDRQIIVSPPDGALPPVPPGTPGVVARTWEPGAIPPEAESIALGFFLMIAAIIIGYPLMRAIARRIERGAPPRQSIPPEVRDQLQQIAQSVDAIAIEVERISEGQRFTTKMLADRARDGTLAGTGTSSPQ